MKITESAMKKIVKVLENAIPTFTVTIYNIRLENDSADYIIRFEDTNNYTHSIYFHGNDNTIFDYGVFDEMGFYKHFSNADITKMTIYDVVFTIATQIKDAMAYVENVIIPHDYAEYHAESVESETAESVESETAESVESETAESVESETAETAESVVRTEKYTVRELKERGTVIKKDEYEHIIDIDGHRIAMCSNCSNWYWKIYIDGKTVVTRCNRGMTVTKAVKHLNKLLGLA